MKWILFHIKRLVSSIAFYPALIAMFFLALSYLMIHVDYSDMGKQIKSHMEWLKLKDASTARTVISVIASGIISLTVFSFTMVMVILNQAASQMSNRVVGKLIGNRFQQIVLGFYIGTIVYSLFLLSAIRDVDSGIYVPSLSTYLLITLTIIDIFFFIYFLHFITQSIKYEVIIRRIQKETKQALKESCHLREEQETAIEINGERVFSPVTGIFQGFDKGALVDLAKRKNFIIRFLYAPGTYILSTTPFSIINITGSENIKDILPDVFDRIYIDDQQTISMNSYYGFRQLTEVAIKALSPGINDPGTAVESLRSLLNLLSFRLNHFPNNHIKDQQGITRVITKELEFEEIFKNTIMPIWDYGKKDRFIQQELQHLLMQMQIIQNHPAINKLLIKIKREIAIDND